MKFNTIDDLKAAGFEGFIPVVQLQADSTAIPRTAGVYMVVYTEGNMPEFLSHGTGGFFKGKDPNVSITELETNWVENTCVVYIGKAGTTLQHLAVATSKPQVFAVKILEHFHLAQYFD